MQHLSKTDSQSVLALRKDFYAMCERENIGLITKCLVQIFQAVKSIMLSGEIRLTIPIST
jgi:hypothetical protein